MFLSDVEFVINYKSSNFDCLLWDNNVWKVNGSHLFLETYLEQLPNVAIDHHKGLLNKMDNAVLDGNVWFYDLGQDDALSMFAISEKIVALDVIWKNISGNNWNVIHDDLQLILIKADFKKGKYFDSFQRKIPDLIQEIKKFFTPTANGVYRVVHEPLCILMVHRK